MLPVLLVVALRSSASDCNSYEHASPAPTDAYLPQQQQQQQQQQQPQPQQQQRRRDCAARGDAPAIDRPCESDALWVKGPSLRSE